MKALAELLAAAQDVIDGADDTGCDGNLTVTYKSAVERLAEALEAVRKQLGGTQ